MKTFLNCLFFLGKDTNLDEAVGQLARSGEVLLLLLVGYLPGSQSAADLHTDGVPVQAHGPDDDLLDGVHLQLAASVSVVLDGRRQVVAVAAVADVLQEQRTGKDFR